MMKLTTNNIDFVKEITKDNISCHWYVAMKSGSPKDSRTYCNYENKVVVMEEYKKEKLPKSVQSFIDSHEKKSFGRIDARHHEYIYK